ncbi:MAG: dTMP kinase [Halobaculum sp.]
MSGLLVVLEGVGGTGKSTLVESVATDLREAGYDVASFGEFSETPYGDALRETLDVHSRAYDQFPMTVTFGAVADHFAQTELELRPALADNEVVLTERYTPTLRVYNEATVRDATTASLAVELFDVVAACTPLEPDLTVLLTLPRDRMETRLADRRGSVSDDLLTVATDRQATYLDTLGDRPTTLVVETTEPESVTRDRIRREIEDRLSGGDPA